MSIRRQAKIANAECGVSGILAHGNGSFLQLLEGPRDAVNAIYAKILRDQRHNGAEILSYAVIRTRSFEEWSMKMISLDEPFAPKRREAVAVRMSGRAFEPLAMSTKQAIGLLTDLAAIERAHAASLEVRVTPDVVVPATVTKGRKATRKAVR